MAALKKLLTLSRSISSGSITPTLQCSHAFSLQGPSESHISPVHLSIYKQFLFVFSRSETNYSGNVSTTINHSSPNSSSHEMKFGKISGSAEDVIWLHNVTVNSSEIFPGSSVSSGMQLGKLVISDESESGTGKYVFLIPSDVLSSWGNCIKEIVSGNSGKKSDIVVEPAPLLPSLTPQVIDEKVKEINDWRTKYAVERALRMRVVDCISREIVLESLKDSHAADTKTSESESTSHKLAFSRYALNDTLGSGDYLSPTVRLTNDENIVTDELAEIDDEEDNDALEDEFKRGVRSRRKTPISLKALDIPLDATTKSNGTDIKKEETVVAKIWTCSWNMGVKEYCKYPQDTSSHVISQIRKKHLEEIKQVVPLGYDIYVFAVQECISDRFFELVSAHLDSNHVSRVDISPEKDRVWGRGDGSFLSPKFTGIALYVSREIIPQFTLLGAAASNLSLFEGSKGGAAVSIKINLTTLVFVSAHLPSKDIVDRRRGYCLLMRNLGNLIGDSNFELLSQFHHVIFMGDLNYRTTGVSMDKVLKSIETANLDDVRQYDELTSDISERVAFLGFQEPSPSSDFFPTYKKKEDRPDRIDLTDSHWLEKTYRTHYKEPWYKSGKVQPRMPSFCDRILYRSLPHPALSLSPDEDKNSKKTSYRAINEHFLGSDHTAVSCDFRLYGISDQIKRNKKYKKKLLHVSILQLGFIKRNYRLSPRNVRVIFPAPWEHGNDKHTSSTITHEMLRSSIPNVFTWKYPKFGSSAHMLFKLETEAELSGECVVALLLEDFDNDKVVTFKEPLFRNGIHLVDIHGDPLYATIELHLSVIHSDSHGAHRGTFADMDATFASGNLMDLRSNGSIGSSRRFVSNEAPAVLTSNFMTQPLTRLHGDSM